jgi:hypothetical protein
VKDGADERRILQSIDLGASFLAALAHPENDALRDAFAGAIICTAFDGASTGDEDIAYEAVRLACVMQDRAKVETTFRQGVRIINEQRLEAAFAAWPEMLRQAGLFEPTARVPTHASKTMLEAVSARVVAKRAERREREKRGSDYCREDGGLSTAFMLTSIWKKSLPVLHMALALDAFTEGSEVKVDDILYNIEHCADIIRYAEESREGVAKIFKIKNQFPALRMAKAAYLKNFGRE